MNQQPKPKRNTDDFSTTLPLYIQSLVKMPILFILWMTVENLGIQLPPRQSYIFYFSILNLLVSVSLITMLVRLGRNFPSFNAENFSLGMSILFVLFVTAESRGARLLPGLTDRLLCSRRRVVNPNQAAFLTTMVVGFWMTFSSSTANALRLNFGLPGGSRVSYRDGLLRIQPPKEASSAAAIPNFEVPWDQVLSNKIGTGIAIDHRKTPSKGYGAFYAGSDTLPEGTFLGFYEGELVKSRESLDMLHEQRRENLRNTGLEEEAQKVGDYVLSLDGGVHFLDGFDLRYQSNNDNTFDYQPFTCAHLNHANKGDSDCNVVRKLVYLPDDLDLKSNDPATTPFWLSDDYPRSLPRVAFFVSRDISTDEELAFDYGTNFWKTNNKFGKESDSTTDNREIPPIKTFVGSITTRRDAISTVATVGATACCCCCNPVPALALAQITAPPPDQLKMYDLPRNVLRDAAFAQGMAVGMGDYEQAAFPTKKRLFESLFLSLKEKAEPVVVEIGIGSFPNAPYYTQRLQQQGGLDIIGVDPNDRMEGYAKNNADRAGLSRQTTNSLRIVHGVSEALPLEDNSCDAVVCSLTLCSVVDPLKSVKEIKRVLKPGGKFLFWEHVLSETNPGFAIQQIQATPMQVQRADGCHLDRRTGEIIRQAEFRSLDMDYLELKDFGFLNPTVCGIATA